MNSNEGLPAYCIIVVQVKEFQATCITKGIKSCTKIEYLEESSSNVLDSSALPSCIVHNSSIAGG